MGKRLAGPFQSKTFKKVVVVVGMLLIVLTFAIYLDPEPFLRFGYLGVFVFNLFGPGTLLIPVLSRYMNVVALAFVSASGIVLNDSVGWVVGKSGDAVITRSKRALMVREIIQKLGFWGLFLWALIPIPHDIVGVVTGYLGFPYKWFVVPTFLGIFVRFLLLGCVTIAVVGRVPV